MYRQKNNFSPYSGRICHKTVRFVFNTVEFDNPYIGRIIRDSYYLNIGLMRQFARDNDIDEIEYLLGIRDALLKPNMAHERQ